MNNCHTDKYTVLVSTLFLIKLINLVSSINCEMIINYMLNIFL